MKTRIKADKTGVACEEAGCSCRVDKPVILIDVEELLSKHSGLRSLLEQLRDNRGGEPRRCDCIIGRVDRSGLVVETVELKGSFAWALGSGVSAVRRLARELAEKHAACIVIAARLLGPSSGIYRLGCITLARTSPMLGPVLVHIARHMRAELRNALQRAAQRGLLPGQPGRYRCYNWADPGSGGRSLVEACGTGCN